MQKKQWNRKLAVYCLITLFLSGFYLVSCNFLFGKIYVGQWGFLVGLLDLVLLACLLTLRGRAAVIALRVLTGLFVLAHIPALVCWVFLGSIVTWLWLWPIGILCHLGMVIWSARLCLGKGTP